jgi:hypothetical protein
MKTLQQGDDNERRDGVEDNRPLRLEVVESRSKDVGVDDDELFIMMPSKLAIRL